MFLLFVTHSVDIGGNLPLVSTTPAVTVAKFATGVADVHRDLRISLRIFRKIPNDPNVIFSGLGEDDS